jgi:hypothetical protein
MDAAFKPQLSNSLTVRGIGSITSETNWDVSPWLKQPKMKKFMGKQDQLAVVAAGMAARDAGLSEEDLRCKTGIYLCVGYIPFEQQDIESIARNSCIDGAFSMDRFSTKGFEQVNPLLTFRCLPNMPIFHVSFNLNIQGPYFITYPSAGQCYVALEQACIAIESGEIQFALVGGVADQNNFLVQHHYSRSGWNTRHSPDAAAFLFLQKESSKRQLLEFKIRYDIARAYTLRNEIWNGIEVEENYGAASLPLFVDRSKNTGRATHQISGPDGIVAESLWIL